MTIRAPDIGDEYALALKRSENTSRGGTIRYFRDVDWPTAHILKIGFSGLCDTDVEAIFEFLSESLGDEIGFLDWLGQQWRGLILDPSGRQVARGINDNSMSFTFRGTIV